MDCIDITFVFCYLFVYCFNDDDIHAQIFVFDTPGRPWIGTPRNLLFNPIKTYICSIHAAIVRSNADMKNALEPNSLSARTTAVT